MERRLARLPETAVSTPSPNRRPRRDALTMASGALAALVGCPFILTAAPEPASFLRGYELVVAGAGSASLGAAALLIQRFQLLARVLALLGFAVVIVTEGPGWLQDPTATFVAALIFITGMLWLFGPLSDWLGEASEPLLGGSGYLRGAIVASLFLWGHWFWAGADASPGSYLPVIWAGAVASGLGLWRVLRRIRIHRRSSFLLLLVHALAAAVLATNLEKQSVVATLPVACALIVGVTCRRKPKVIVARGTFWESLLGHPERLFVGTFASFAVLGTIALSLPASSTHGAGLDFIDALFTSTSAICITGLTTVDLSVDLTPLGQVFVLVLVQIGGLGIMTFSTVILWALGRRMSLRHEGAVATLLSPHDRGRLFDAARQVIAFTLATELLGALILTLLFFHAGDTLSFSLWRGLFTSISAFCNAGFALQSDSLVSYQSSPLVLHTVATLILFGGISPIVAFALPALIRRSVRPVAVQAKLALVAAAVLTVVGFGLILAFEWQSSLGGLSVVDKIHNAWFQSVTLRSAGFNSVDVQLIQPATFVVMIIWMFIGGSPGSTAGGVKTTTLAILLLSVAQTIRGQMSLEVFGRTIPEKTKTRAVAVTCIAASTGVLALIALQLTQDMPEREAWFEVFSALGTTGLSIGGTSRLDFVGKLMITACMFVGRVGGLTLLMFLKNREFVPNIGRPVEEVDVG